MAAQGSGLKVVLSAISGNTFITIIKFIGWFFTKSPSLLAEAVHSLADTLNQILLFIGLKHSEKEKSEAFPVGYGRSRYVWNLVSAVGVFFLGFGVTAYHGIHALIAGGHHSPKINWIGITVLTVSFIIELVVLIQAYKEVSRAKGKRSFLEYFKENDDPTSVAVLLEDGVAVLGVILAFIGIILGHVFHNPYFDIAASLIIALLLGFLGIALGVVNGRLLFGKSVAVSELADIKSFIETFPEVKKVTNLHTTIMGAGEVRLTLEVEIDGNRIIDVGALTDDVKRLELGENPMRILMGSSERMIRLVGSKINILEMAIHERFPEITSIDFEIN